MARLKNNGTEKFRIRKSWNNNGTKHTVERSFRSNRRVLVKHSFVFEDGQRGGGTWKLLRDRNDQPMKLAETLINNPERIVEILNVSSKHEWVIV